MGHSQCSERCDAAAFLPRLSGAGAVAGDDVVGTACFRRACVPLAVCRVGAVEKALGVAFTLGFLAVLHASAIELAHRSRFAGGMALAGTTTVNITGGVGLAGGFALVGF